jgi:hypothetical protein
MVNGLDEQHVLINGHGRRYLDAFAFEHLRWCSSVCTVAPTKIELFQSENHLYHNLPQVSFDFTNTRTERANAIASGSNVLLSIFKLQSTR